MRPICYLKKAMKMVVGMIVMKVGIAKETWRIGESEEHEGTKMVV